MLQLLAYNLPSPFLMVLVLLVLLVTLVQVVRRGPIMDGRRSRWLDPWETQRDENLLPTPCSRQTKNLRIPLGIGMCWGRIEI